MVKLVYFKSFSYGKFIDGFVKIFNVFEVECNINLKWDGFIFFWL